MHYQVMVVLVNMQLAYITLLNEGFRPRIFSSKHNVPIPLHLADGFSTSTNCYMYIYFFASHTILDLNWPTNGMKPDNDTACFTILY